MLQDCGALVKCQESLLAIPTLFPLTLDRFQPAPQAIVAREVLYRVQPERWSVAAREPLA